jgi:antitoxin CptB
MSSTTIDQQVALENRRKRLLYQSQYRGVKENDIILGRFAQEHIQTLDAQALDDYEKLLQQPDNDIYDWLAGREKVPAEFDTPVMRQLLGFKVSQGT